MSTFKIEIKPALPKSVQCQLISLDNINARTVLEHYPEEYEIIYHLNGRSFQYYPTNIMTILNDLHQEWELIRNRAPHLMTLSGYTVLEIVFEGESAVFLDPLESFAEKKRIGGAVWAVAVEDAFRSATEQVLCAVRDAGG